MANLPSSKKQHCAIAPSAQCTQTFSKIATEDGRHQYLLQQSSANQPLACFNCVSKDKQIQLQCNIINQLTKSNQLLQRDNTLLKHNNSFLLTQIQQLMNKQQHGHGPNGDNKKRKKRKTCKKQATVNSSSYDPPSSQRAAGHINISRELTEQIVPNTIDERLSNVFNYTDKSLALNVDSTNTNHANIRVINYDLHHRQTKQVLYFVARAQSRGHPWKMDDALYTAEEVEQKFNIPADKLPKTRRPCTSMIFAEQSKVTNVLNKHKSLSQIIHETKWSKVDVFGTESDRQSKRRILFKLMNQDFMQRAVQYVQTTVLRLVPIIMFKDTRYMLQFVVVVRIEMNIDIGLALQYDAAKNSVFVAGIHLSRDRIFKQHELLQPGHAKHCHCLDSFVSNLDDLRIGNLDEEENKIKDLQGKCENYEKFMSAFVNTPNLNAALMHRAQSVYSQSSSSITPSLATLTPNMFLFPAGSSSACTSTASRNLQCAFLNQDTVSFPVYHGKNQ